MVQCTEKTIVPLKFDANKWVKLKCFMDKAAYKLFPGQIWLQILCLLVSDKFSYCLLQSGLYETVEALQDEIELCFTNAQTYNEPNSMLYKVCSWIHNKQLPRKNYPKKEPLK